MTAALRLEPDAREPFLRAETQGDTELFDETIQMVVDEDDATQLIEDSQRRSPHFDEAYLAGKKQIGSYRLLRRIGQGGMGMVYAACLVAEDFQRQVALKLVKPSLASSNILRRFRMERQVLAGLDHPNIARLLDAGTTDEGAPYLVMEYVEGLPIDRYCESLNLPIADRLKLFLTVCDAVQYAHQNLIIHRDIKPSNILVTPDGSPKLLDFGIAKLVRPEETAEDPSLKLTATDSRPMSPHYASPEQARGELITTASDVYSLGVLLYELLTGQLPYEFKLRSAAHIEQTICEAIPKPPSEVDYRGTLPEPVDRLRKRLRGDLDMILLMAMRKEASRRYYSVAQFSEDIRNHLTGLPVIAQKDTFGYRMSKFVRRHRAGVAAATLAVLALISSTVVSLYFAREATREKGIAERRFQETRDLARFFLTDFDSAIKTSQTEARQALVSKGLEYLKRLSAEAGQDADLVREVAAGYLTMGDVQGNPFVANLGDREGARQSYQAALRLAESVAPSGGGLTVRARLRLADLEAVGGNRREALAVYQRELGGLTGLEVPKTLNKIAFLQDRLGDSQTALENYTRSMDLLRADLGRNPDAKRSYAQALQQVGELLSRLTQHQDAIRYLEQSLAMYRELGSSVELTRNRWRSSILLAGVYERANRRQDGEAAYRDAVKLAESFSSADPANQMYQRDLVSSLQRFRDFLAVHNESPSEQRQLTLRLLSTLQPMVERPDAAAIDLHLYVWSLLKTPFADLRRPVEALAYAKKWVERTGTGDAESLDGLAQAYFGVGDAAKAIELERKALALLPASALNAEMRKELEANLRRFEAAARPTEP